jgi:hypothetical protein
MRWFTQRTAIHPAPASARAAAPVSWATLATLGLVGALGLPGCGSSTSTADAGDSTTSTDGGAPPRTDGGDATTGSPDVTSIFGDDSSAPPTPDATLDANDDVATINDASDDVATVHDGGVDTGHDSATPHDASEAKDAGKDSASPPTCTPVTVSTGTAGSFSCGTTTMGMCGPANVATFVPTTPPTTGAAQGLCTTAQIQSIYNGCLGSSGSDAACTTAFNAATNCYNCIFTKQSDAKWGPVVTTTNGLANLNVGGCIDLLEPCNATCAATFENDLECEQKSCSTNCPITADAGSQTAYDNCANTVDLCDPGGCAAYFNGTGCGSELTGAGHPASACVGPQNTEAAFESEFLALVPVFCGN